MCNNKKYTIKILIIIALIKWEKYFITGKEYSIVFFELVLDEFTLGIYIYIPNFKTAPSIYLRILLLWN